MSRVDTIDANLQKSIKETEAIESFVNGQSTQSARQLDAERSRQATSSPTSAEIDPIAENYYLFKRQQKITAHIGASPSPHYQPHQLIFNPPKPCDVTLELLLASQSHLGHCTSVWNPANAKYIFGIRDGIHIISLDVTAAHLRRAAKVVSEVTRRGGIVLFVGTRDGQERAVVRAAELAGGYHLFERWTPGSITNRHQLLGRCKLKVVNEFNQEVPGFEEQLHSRAALKPDLVVCLNPLENYVLLRECAQNHIPTIGIIDTNANPTWVTYPIPANDDSIRCVTVIAGALGRAGQEGHQQRLEAAQRGLVTYPPPQGLTLTEEMTGKQRVKESEPHDEAHESSPLFRKRDD